MTDVASSPPPTKEELFIRPPRVESMQDPLAAEWNGPPEALAELSIDFTLLNDIFANFLEVVGLPVAIIGLGGRVLASSRWQRLCMEFHRVAPGCRSRCIESDVHLSRAMEEGQSFAIYRCRNGLTDCATPIVVEGRHVANLFVGQFLLAAPDTEAFRAQARQFGFDEAAYLAALAEVPIVAEARLPAILRLVGGMARQIAGQSLAERRARAAFESSERRLDASHERLRRIAAQVPGVVYQFVRGPDGAFAIPYASDAFATIFGLAPGLVRADASAVFDTLHPDDVAPVRQAIAESAATLAPWRLEFRVRIAGGGWRWVYGDAVPQARPDGGVVWHGFITDITERKRTEELLAARLRLAERSSASSLHDLLVATLDEACALTGSSIGFYHFLLPDQNTLALQAWSTATTRQFCSAAAESQHYPVGLAGVWADCVRLRRSVTINDYAALPDKKGLPEGHASVTRLVSVPIFRDGQITAVIGVGNKPTPFEEADLAAIETLADLAWDLAERKRAEDALAEHAEVVRRRYEALRALSDIAALPPGGQIAAALALGARHLGLPIGILSRIEGDTYTVVERVAPPDSGLEAGQAFPLGQTYCVLTLEGGDVLAIEHMENSSHAGHPCYRAFGLEAYLGAPVSVRGKPFGTINFSAPIPYPRRFDEGDREFMRLLARWAGIVLERELFEAELLAAKETAEARAEELAASNADLEQFAYVASHDLRQPLRMVNSYLALIERRYQDKLDDDGREFIAFARDGAKQMDRLILDLLDYSRIGRTGQEIEALDLAQLAADACHQLGVLIAETGCAVSLAQDAAPVAGVRSELVRLFQNLIGNAVKYRSPDRAPEVRVEWTRQGGDWRVVVRDNGIGIAPEFHQDVFKIFRRLHTAQEYEGTGIGLAICQKIVKRHGGQIGIEPGGGPGTAFVFTIPAASAESVPQG